MNLPQLIDLVTAVDWFSEVGTYTGAGNRVAITSLVAPGVLESWQWLPTSRDEPDPFHSPPLKEVTEQQGKGPEAKDAALLVYKAALVSLRCVDEANPRFIFGPQNFVTAAKGGALYAARQSAVEIITGNEAGWCSLIALYSEGHWPCGYTESRKILVY